MARIAASIIARGRSQAKLAMCILASAIVVSCTLDLRLAAAQGVVVDGNAVVTGFSGMQLPTLIRSGTDPAERATIDLNGPVLRVIDLQVPGAAPQAQVLTAAKPFTIAARQIGQVFAVVLDNASPPNIYAAATSLYGLPIVVPDVDGDGVPDRWEEGTVNASFMSGLFGPRQSNGGPGSIWRIDGATGAVGLFANVTLDGAPNSGAALGGLAFDRISNTLFVADRETGVIHRFDLNGSERGRYDHGTQGRPAAGLPAVSFDPARRMVITRPPFQPANPESWGYALPQRRVFGLAVREGRLYYAVAENLQVWSVAITPDGFGTDARIEVTVSPSQSASEISKIAFDDRGRMLLAERSAPTGAFDFTALTEEGGGRVLRYAKTPSTTGPAWQPTPDEYTIGFAAQMRGNGGVAVGYGYDADGRLDRNACSGFVWSTGEQLRVSSDATQAAQLAPGGPAIVNGLQGTGIDLVRASNFPRREYFVDYDDRFDDPNAHGQMGDVAVFRTCAPGAMIAQLPPAIPAAPLPGAPVPAPGIDSGIGVGNGVGPGLDPIGKPDLALSKTIQAGPTVAPGAAVPNACVPTAPCWFRVTVTNHGPGAFSGPLNVTDTMPAGWTFVSAAAPWACQAAGAAVACARAAMTLAQGQSTTLDIQMQPPAPPGGQPVFVENCAELDWKGGAGDANKANDRACYKLVLAPAATGNFDLTIAKKGPAKCVAGQPCIFNITVQNLGTGNYQGVLSVEDVSTPGLTFSGSPTTPWTCVTGAAGTVKCNYGQASIPSGPGSTLGMLILNFTVPANLPAGTTQIKNCVKVIYNGTSAANTHPDEHCVTIAVEPAPAATGNFDLTIAKKGPAKCVAGQPCSFNITVQNLGAGNYQGQLSVEDVSTPGLTFSGSTTAPWTCVTGAAGTVKCNYGQASIPSGPGSILPMLNLNFTVPANLPAGTTQIKNCAKVVYSGTSAVNTHPDEDCTIVAVEQPPGPQSPVPPGGGTATMTPPGTPSGPSVVGPDGLSTATPALGDGAQPSPGVTAGGIKVSKKGPDSGVCEPGKTCDFTISIRGATSVPYTDVFEVRDIPPPGWTFVAGGKPGDWNCAAPANCTYDITKNTQWSNSGLSAASAWLMTNITFKVPDNAQEGMVENCVNATLPPAPGQTGKTIEVACAKVWVGHAPKLTVTKEFDTSSCAPGEECSYTVTVKNEGKGAYTGLLDLRDSGGSPYGLGIDSVNGKDWKCSIFSDSFTCDKLSLKAGESVSIRVKAKIKKDMNTALFNEISNCAILHVYETDPKKLTEGQKQYLVRDFLRFNGYDLSTVSTVAGGTTKKSPYGEGALSEAEKKMLADYNSKHGNPDISGEITDDLIKSLLPQVANETSFPGDCATIKVREPGVAIRKVMVRSADVPADVPATGPKAAKCAVGDICVWEIEVYGTEAAPYTKPLKIEESLPNGFELVDYKPKGPGGWSCSGSPYKLICTHPPANVTHSASLKLQIYARMPKSAELAIFGPLSRHPWVTNCVKVIYDDLKKYQEQQEPDKPWQACDKERISSGWDLNHYDYDATGSGPCLPPKCSFYEFTITGRENIARGPLTQRIMLPPGSAFPQARVIKAPALCPASGWSCTKSGGLDGPFACNIANCTLQPGEQVTVRLEGNVAPDLKEPPPAPLEKTACGVLEYETGAFETGIEQLAGKQTKEACATITVMARPPACAPGYVKTADGLCCLASQMTVSGVCCPPGQQPDSRRQHCVPLTPTTPTFVPPSTPAACPAGTVRARSGECCVRSQMTTRGVCCPPGTRPDSRRLTCVPLGPERPAVTVPQCTGGKVLIGNRCVCPAGTIEQRGVCVRPPPPPPKCTGGKLLVENRCVCPSGTIEQRGMCVRPPPPPPRCTGGKVLVQNRCVCPAGTIEQRGMCVRRPPPPQPSPARPSQIRPLTIPGARVICPAGEVWSEPYKKCLPRLR